MSCSINQLKMLRKTSTVKITIFLRMNLKEIEPGKLNVKLYKKYEKISISSVVLTKIYIINEKR